MAANPDIPDKQALYGDYRNSRAWQDELYRQASHKALDIAMPGGVNAFTDNSKSGPSILSMAALAATGGALGIGGLLAANMLQDDAPPAPPAPAVEFDDDASRLRLGKLVPDGS